MNGRVAIGLAAAVALSVAATACDTVECAEGTAQVDGACVLQVDAGPTAQCCGPGTHLEAGDCLPDEPATRCDPNTTTSVLLEDGALCCIGTGSSGCAITCKSPDPGKVTLCGQLIDVETGINIGDAGSGTRCDPDNPTSAGPCSVRLRVFDALQFAAAPTSAAPLVADEIVINDCGAWMVHNIPAPPLGHVAVATDDHPSSGQTAYVATASSSAVQGGERYPHQLTYASRSATVDTWTATAGDPFSGDSFVERGAALLIFSFGRDPVAGVTVTPAGFPFTDTEPFRRTTISSTQQSTGANGSVLVTDSWAASGAETAGCTWGSPITDAVPGVLWVQHVHSTDESSSARCAPPCPPDNEGACTPDGPGACSR